MNLNFDADYGKVKLKKITFYIRFINEVIFAFSLKNIF